jgi:hypothetical protein
MSERPDGNAFAEHTRVAIAGGWATMTPSRSASASRPFPGKAEGADFARRAALHDPLQEPLQLAFRDGWPATAASGASFSAMFRRARRAACAPACLARPPTPSAPSPSVAPANAPPSPRSRVRADPRPQPATQRHRRSECDQCALHDRTPPLLRLVPAEHRVAWAGARQCGADEDETDDQQDPARPPAVT